MQRKFVFLYLNTGSGHISAAKTLKNALENEYPGTEVHLLHGFGEGRNLGKLIFEKIYALACNYIPGLYPLIYDTAQHRFVQSLYVAGLSVRVPKRLRRFILKNRITDVISFHFALTPPLVKVLKYIPWKVNVSEVVTDPFNGTHAWFYERESRFLVYSERMKEEAVTECGVKPSHIKLIPFLSDPKFKKKLSEAELTELFIKHGFTPGKKIVLFAGGGEGLAGILKIINRCILHSANFAIAVVCGRDAAGKKKLEAISKKNPSLSLHVFGFVDFMDELVKICSCAVIKAGPATLMEVLQCKKPVIICRYIHNQELENVRYVVKNKLGWFISDPDKIFDKINEVLTDESLARKTSRRFDDVKIDTDVLKAAGIVYENEWADETSAF
ncbi:glycosyltransferase [Treponema parvum]|uniref:Glycosyltransferase n=1 Tax=Treponema parvum TaxID=138851 RepID=A0A975EZV1_9SPIR|nr:glycosyltransferase [Treponema parvum]QTQ11695.1 glycosyltransferase [Treponema parvum]